MNFAFRSLVLGSFAWAYILVLYTNYLGIRTSRSGTAHPCMVPGHTMHCCRPRHASRRPLTTHLHRPTTHHRRTNMHSTPYPLPTYHALVGCPLLRNQSGAPPK
ncbi:hypothetical protein BDZ89DRAFT_579307 [Hymenopellis radicata]|nr:hypothetical protein BDZ89DRAFT_579307 [Hymenopellis radicata]